jgi:hypothetical protein
MAGAALLCKHVIAALGAREGGTFAMRRGTKHQPRMAPMVRCHRPMIGFMPPEQRDDMHAG